MDGTQVLAQLRVTPAIGFGSESTTLVLQQRNDAFRILVVERKYDLPRPLRRRVRVDAAEANHHLELLKRATVPAFPESPQACDGSYWSLKIQGECSALTLGCWTAAPRGAERLANFADWLYQLAFPD
jgi:hypothetical protein